MVSFMQIENIQLYTVVYRFNNTDNCLRYPKHKICLAVLSSLQNPKFIFKFNSYYNHIRPIIIGVISLKKTSDSDVSKNSNDIVKSPSNIIDKNIYTVDITVVDIRHKQAITRN